MPINANFLDNMYNNKMMSKISKETILYESLKGKLNDKDFIISFNDYFSFILNDCVDICAHLNESIEERTKEKNSLDNLYTEIITNVKDFVKDVERFLEKENLQNDPIFKDRIKDTKSLIDNTTYVLGGERLDSIQSEMSDIARRLLELGFEKELSKYVRIDRSSKLNPEDIIALEKRKQFITEKSNFNKKDIRSLAGVFLRLGELYINMGKAENSKGDKIKLETIFEDLDKRNKDIEYSKLMSGVISEGSYFRRDRYISDIERFHQSIVMNNPEVNKEVDKMKDIFYLKGDDVYHYEIGKLDYELNGLKDPKYIKMFKNVLNYMPVQKNKVRISELEKNINKKDKCGTNYRTNLGKSAKPFNNFLYDNGIKNIHPEKGVPIISATDEYITFYKKI